MSYADNYKVCTWLIIKMRFEFYMVLAVLQLGGSPVAQCYLNFVWATRITNQRAQFTTMIAYI